jgi:hypothetical protein
MIGELDVLEMVAVSSKLSVMLGEKGLADRVPEGQEQFRLPALCGHFVRARSQLSHGARFLIVVPPASCTGRRAKRQ